MKDRIADMAKIVWLASYPKSGNTWVRFILANLLRGTIENSEEVSNIIPDIHKGIRADQLLNNKVTFIKSHIMYSDRLPLREDTVGVIYVVRNPLDVLASAINYLELRRWKHDADSSQTGRSVFRQAIIKEFLEEGGLSRLRNDGTGTWAAHVASWHRRGLPFPRLTLRYEDLRADPAPRIARLCRFIGINRSGEEIEAALAASSFRAMRGMEEREVNAGQPGFFVTENPAAAFSRGLRFINTGASGGYREILTEKQIELARKRFGPMIAKLGYEV